MAARVSLAELAAAGFVLHSGEAAAIVVDVCRQFERGTIRGIPSTHVIRLTPDGTVVAQGPIRTDHPPIAKAAQLLNDLLPPFNAPPAYRVPGGLRLIIARALGTLDLPPFGSLDEFRTAIARFAAEDVASTARNLYRAWEIGRTPRTLTISDVRRARRATGLSLQDVSLSCGVSAERLRELEWGYLKNWRNDAVGRSWLAGYAKASGLDEQLVTSIVAPMLEEADLPALRDDCDEVALVASGPQVLIPTRSPELPPRKPWSILWALASAASIAVLALVGTMAWPRQAPAFAEATAGRAAYSDTTADKSSVTAPALPDASGGRVIPAVQTSPLEKPAVSNAHTAARHTGASGRRPSKPNFFKRQLLRIVIK